MSEILKGQNEGILREYFLELTGRLSPIGYYNAGDYENPPEMELDRREALELFGVPFETIRAVEAQAEAYMAEHAADVEEYEEEMAV